MVEAPRPGAELGKALRGTFGLLEDAPCDMLRALERLRGIA
jgi:hypothetical protein